MVNHGITLPNPPPGIQAILLTMDQSGNVSIQGNVQNMLIALGMFEVGKKKFGDWFDKQAQAPDQPQIAAASPADLAEIDRVVTPRR